MNTTERNQIRSPYFTDDIANFVSEKCVFSECFSHLLINCESEEVLVFLVRNRKHILSCKWATLMAKGESKKASFLIRG